MDSAINFIQFFIENHKSFEYLIIFAWAILGGELALFSLGFLIASKYLPILPTLVLAFVGSFVPNIVWFLCGKSKIINKIIINRYADSAISSLTDSIHKITKSNYLLGIVIAKFLVGTPVILMLYINKTKLSFEKFMYYESVAILLSVMFIMPIGFASGFGFNYLANILENIYGILGFLLLTLVAVFVINSLFKKIFIEKIILAETNKDIEL